MQPAGAAGLQRPPREPSLEKALNTMKGCNAKLSDKIEKRALKWAKDKGKSASDHNCLCYKHYKEMVNKDMQGVTDAMHVVLTSSTHSGREPAEIQPHSPPPWRSRFCLLLSLQLTLLLVAQR
jgi:hypothetical protein